MTEAAYQFEPMTREELEYWADGRPDATRVKIAKTALYWMDRATEADDAA